MSEEPFRDGMNAALSRIDKLAGENEELRAELDALRHAADHAKSKSTDEHANALADQTLALLDRLDTLSQRAPKTEAAAVHFQTEAELSAEADASVLGGTGTAARPLAPVMPAALASPESVMFTPATDDESRTRWFTACIFVFGFGVLVGHCV